ncbi:MAG: NCS2 family permease [Micrococcales bacterium]|nr:NCS2 family permease [Micrococcales bacterium]
MAKTSSATVTPKSALDRYFFISERGSTVGREVRGGLVTFFTMSYILVLNPLILGTLPSAQGTWIGGGADGPNFGAVAVGTAVVAGVMTILMGVVARFPLALAAGLGLNAVVTFTLATMKDMSFADAMGVIVLEGILILVLVLTGFREAVFKAVPGQLKVAISVGIGLFIAFIGLYDARFSTDGAGTPVGLGIDNSLRTWPVLVFVVGLLLAIILMVRKVPGALLIAIVVSTVLAVIVQAIAKLGPAVEDPNGWSLTVPEYSGVVATPDFSILGQFSILGAAKHLGPLVLVLMVFTLMLADFFDTMGTMVAVGAEGGLLDKNGNPPRTREILVVDSVGAIAGGAGGVSSNTAYIESASGVGDGARTGLASVVTGLCFLLSIFFAPLVSMVPFEAATPALVVVGFLMMMQVADISWKDYEIAIPAFLTIIVMPFTYSITNGIGVGFIAYAVLKLVKGKIREVHPLLWATAALFIIFFAQGPILDLIR